LWKESQFNPKAKSPAGAQGIGQFMPATAREEGVDVNDPKSSIYGAARYYAKMKNTIANGNDQLAMAAYNWGPGNVQKWLKSGADLSKVPAETRDYVNAISGRPLAPNMAPKTANAPAAGAAPMAAETAGNGNFVIPGRQSAGYEGGYNNPYKAAESAVPMQGGPYVGSGQPSKVTNRINAEIAPAPPSPPSPSQGVSPLVEQFNRPPVQRGGQQGVSPAVQEANRGQPPVQWPPERGAFVPGTTPPTETTTPTPEQSQPQQQQPSGQSPALQGFGQDLRLQKLWQYMLIKSLLPEIKFRNIGYDPWAVHRFGQGGGY
jgi:hypothetical protein